MTDDPKAAADTSEIIVSESRFHNYGSGATLAEAVDDFLTALVEARESLDERESTLDTHLTAQLEYLRGFTLPMPRVAAERLWRLVEKFRDTRTYVGGGMYEYCVDAGEQAEALEALLIELGAERPA